MSETKIERPTRFLKEVYRDDKLVGIEWRGGPDYPLWACLEGIWDQDERTTWVTPEGLIRMRDKALTITGFSTPHWERDLSVCIEAEAN